DAWVGFPEIQVHNFDWVNDFSKARNYSFSHAKSDYIMWLDGDDLLSDPAAFIQWRDKVMHSAHYWVALYNYAYDPKGNPICQFVRERVVKNNYGFEWEYFVHEGILQKDQNKKYWPQRVSSWTVNHRRTEEDQKQDRGRNIKLMEAHDTEALPPRMKFYYGKELFENGQPEKAGKPLMEALKSKELDIHDRLLSIQYAASSALSAKAYPQAITILLSGIALSIHRAEFWVLLGDTYLALNDLDSAYSAYSSATRCAANDYGGSVVVYKHAYGEYPLTQMANISIQRGDIVKAEEHIKSLSLINKETATTLQNNLNQLKDLNMIRDDLPKVDDIIITCPPGGAVKDWDENTLETKGHGGSETAAIEVARWLKKKTNRKVKIFHERAKRDVMPSGVEYLPVNELAGYLQNLEPHAHIAWRHAVPLSKANSIVWCHDLQCAGAERPQNYGKIMALSGFHKHYLMETNGVPEDKITMGFNGINPDDFKESYEKDPLKVVFSSSPDRGLVQSIDIVQKARDISGLDIKLHCFYGVENMRLAGHNDWADAIEKKIKDHKFVVSHGMVNKKVLMKHFKEAGVWLYPADFIETFCITAIESLCAGTWGIVRSMGALPYTLDKAIKQGMVDMLDVEATGDAAIGVWANCLVEAIFDKKWERVKVDPNDYGWERVADVFVKEMHL
ncbi:MAG: hypothetical protein V4440_12490, partial [Pseudomonadota bacterium]